MTELETRYDAKNGVRVEAATPQQELSPQEWELVEQYMKSAAGKTPLDRAIRQLQSEKALAERKVAEYEKPVTDEEWNAAAEALGERSWAAGESDSRLDEHYRALDTIYNRLCKERDDAVAGAERLVHAKRPKRVRQRQEEGL